MWWNNIFTPCGSSSTGDPEASRQSTMGRVVVGDDSDPEIATDDVLKLEDRRLPCDPLTEDLEEEDDIITKNLGDAQVPNC